MELPLFIASHILSELYKLATHYAIIDGGRLIDEFSKEELESECSSSVNIVVEPQCLQQAENIIKQGYPTVQYEVVKD